MTGPSDVHLLDQRTSEERDRTFLPGMSRTWLMPVYDVFTRFAGVRALYERVTELAGIVPGATVLDVGCGTGSLSLSVLAACPDARVTGLDPDSSALRRAARKARRRGRSLTLVQGYADRLPADDASVDQVVSSLALHHLDGEGRQAFAREALRALRRGGTVTVADFGGPVRDVDTDGQESGRAHGHGPGHALRHLPGMARSRGQQRPTAASNDDDDIVALLTAAGFSDAREVDHVDHRFGRVVFVQARRP